MKKIFEKLAIANTLFFVIGVSLAISVFVYLLAV